MFCGWRLANSYADIGRLGSSTLEIDALTGTATFKGAPLDAPLAVARELQAWLVDDCQTNDIPIEELESAILLATLDLSKTDWHDRRSNAHWFPANGPEIKGRQVNRCVIQCKSTIKTGGFEYRSQYRDIEEWPEGFPR